MSPSDRASVITALRLVAAQAQKLADDVENGRLWPGELNDGLSVINRAMRDLPTQRI